MYRVDEIFLAKIDLNKKTEKVESELDNSSSVRLIGANGEPVGIVSLSEAQKAAEKAGLDLVIVSKDSNPPVCKILDYGKEK